MTSYDQALFARDGAIKLVESFGATVLKVKPARKKNNWYVEVVTARPLPDGHSKLKAEGVDVVVADHGLDTRLKPRR